MENPILISVIVPAHNAGKYMAQCIDNLLCQTYKNLEIIIVDDGSTDNTARIIQQYPTVKYIYQQNSGVSSARNRAMDAAIGEYIHFMDADDLINLAFYEEMILAAVATHSDMACCGFIFERFPSQTQKIEHTLLASNTEDKIWMTNVLNYGACWKYIYKLSFLRENDLYFDVERIAGEDRIFSLQAVFYANRIVSVPGAVYIYKNRKDSITTTRKNELVKKRRKSRKYAEQFQADFAKQHHFSPKHPPGYQRWQYKLLGLPLATKRVYHRGTVKWYFLNIPVFQKKEIDI